MLRGATLRAAAMTGAAVFRMVVSNDSMKNATATSHGNTRLPAVCRGLPVVGFGIAAVNRPAAR
jgi:hypothetical protein